MALSEVKPHPILHRLIRRDGSEFIVDHAEMRRIDGLKRKPYSAYAGLCEIHQCSVCGARDAWREGWQWYGSYKDMDEGKPILKMCGDQCRVKAVADKMVPRNAPCDDQ